AEWGVQSHPSLDSVLVQRVQTLRDAGYPDRYAVGMVERHHAMPRADDARDLCEHRARTGHLSWVDILVEEVAEAIEAATLHGEGDELRAEVVQVAAVAVAWLEAIDARAAGRCRGKTRAHASAGRRPYSSRGGARTPAVLRPCAPG